MQVNQAVTLGNWRIVALERTVSPAALVTRWIIPSTDNHYVTHCRVPAQAEIAGAVLLNNTVQSINMSNVSDICALFL